MKSTSLARTPASCVLIKKVYRRLSGFVFASAAVCGMVGCDTLKSTGRDVALGKPSKPHVGNYYFLPRGVIQIDGAPAAKDAEFQVSIKVQNVPDKTHRYFLRHVANVFYDDDLQIKVNAKGLLETIDTTTEDKTPAIIDKVTDTIIDVARIAASGPTGLFRTENQIMEEVTLKPFHVIFDPLDPKQRQDAVDILYDCGFKLEFPGSAAAVAHVASDKKVMIQETRATVSQDSSNLPDIAAGVVYRPPTAIEVAVSTRGSSTTGLLQRVWIRLPSPNEFAVVDTSRSFLIKKKNSYALVDGDLMQIDHNRPSQALALVSIPASVAHKVAEAIPTLISIQDKRATRVPPDLAAEKAQLDAQTALLNSKTALIDAQKKLQAAEGSAARNVPLTREALKEQAIAEKEEAKARSARARADNEESQSRAERAVQERSQQRPAPPTPPVSPTPNN